MFSFNLVTNLNQDFSNFNFVSTDVWNLDFDSHFVIKT
ncbi:dihydrolipoyllysine-residue acetyltransferase component of pyruvate dehydrogenase complex domain protein [Bacillus mycoides]|nr:dihydrolipoyllysine-residue acetyltransferase component of pyruvate dehydrogenase complex domain protein [Bacillus mycoides]